MNRDYYLVVLLANCKQILVKLLFLSKKCFNCYNFSGSIIFYVLSGDRVFKVVTDKSLNDKLAIDLPSTRFKPMYAIPN